MLKPDQNAVVLIADDDEEDRSLLKDAFINAGLTSNHLRFVEDGMEVMEYLQGLSKYHDVKLFPTPNLILLDLSMPLKNGFETLRAIRSSELFGSIPVIIVSTSTDPDVVSKCYHLGANAFIQKPSGFISLLTIVEGLLKFWFEIVELPPQNM
jgi:CheY-like chemotaxis protein